MPEPMVFAGDDLLLSHSVLELSHGTEMTFVEMGLVEPILRAVTAEGYETPTPIQAAAIPPAMEGRDLLGCAQTGTGKTAAFSLPILHRLASTPPVAPASGKNGRGVFRRIRCLILSPTRELAIQIGDSLSAYGCHTGLRHTVIVGGVGQNPQVHALQRGVDILVATPGRLEDLRQQGYIDLRAVEIFVLDEADRMLDMGFLPSIRRIVEMLPDQKQTLFFSATMPREIADLAEGILHNPARVRIAPVKQTTELISHSVYHVPKPQKARLLATLLTNQPISRAIVFCRTKHGADRLAHQLEKVGIAALALHGDKSQSSRQRALAHFKSSHPPILVATDVAARGIDIDSVSHVFNFDLPNESETYVHRCGRTGRAGSAGQAVSFCDETERDYLKSIEKLIRQQLTVIPLCKLNEFPAKDDRLEGKSPVTAQSQRDSRLDRGESRPNAQRDHRRRGPQDRGPQDRGRAPQRDGTSQHNRASQRSRPEKSFREPHERTSNSSGAQRTSSQDSLGRSVQSAANKRAGKPTHPGHRNDQRGHERPQRNGESKSRPRDRYTRSRGQ